MALEDLIEELKYMSTADQLRMAKEKRFTLIVLKESVNSTSADGVSIARDLNAINELIKTLKQELAEESACSNKNWQIRLNNRY